MLLLAEMTLGFFKCMKGQTQATGYFDYGHFSEEKYTSVFRNAAPVLYALLRRYQIQSYCIFEMYDKGEELVRERNKWIGMIGELDLHLRQDYYVHAGVVVAGLYQANPQPGYDEVLGECVANLRLLMQENKENFAHGYWLLKAEHAKIKGNYKEAVEGYGKACQLAKQNGYPAKVALASEQFAKFWLAENQRDLATPYVQQAHKYYGIWGATAKVRLLEEKYPNLLAINNENRFLASTVSIHTTNGSLLLDLDTILKASQALSQEVKTDDLVQKMLHIVIENTGAGKGFLIGQSSDGLRLRAKGNTVQSEVLKPAPDLQACDYLPVSLIDYVARSKQAEVLDNASIEGSKYADDSYIKTRQPKSVLCYPVLRQEELSIIFYLENNLATGAFTPSRLEMLRILSSQMAISIENALLYENLEQKVKLRTLQISEKNKELVRQTNEIQTQAEELKKINEKLIELDDFKQGVTGMIVHDLKNPLNTLLAFAKSPEIEQSARQMLQMVLNILDVQKIETTGLQLHWDVFGVKMLCKEAIDQVKVLSRQKNIKMQQTNLQNIEVKADQGVTLRILVNLLTNAIKHAPLNSCIDIRSKVLSDDRVEIWVIDEGKGVPAYLHTQIFDKFFSPDARHDSRTRSTGLGLAFCKLAAEAQGGEIGVKNIQGKGAGFWFTLQQARQSEESSPMADESGKLTGLGLTTEDKNRLYAQATRLLQVDLYEMGKIKKIVDQISNESAGIRWWKEQLTEATFSMNEAWFAELVQLVLK